MYKNVAAPLQLIERAQREQGEQKLCAAPGPGAAKLGPLQKVVAFGPLAPQAPDAAAKHPTFGPAN